MRTVVRCGGSILRALIHIGLCFWGMNESVLGIMQVFGLRSPRHAMFALTGHFDNPGPFGGFIACITAVAAVYAIRFRRRRKGPYRGTMMWVSLAMVCCGILVLPASLSRTAWLGLIVAIAVSLFLDRDVREWMRKHRIAAFSLTVFVLASACSAFFIKRDSAIGRFHIWHMDVLAMQESPWRGHGAGYEMGAYGCAQERYFREHLDSGDVGTAVIRAAGCPEYPFNEFLGAGMAYGVPAMMLICVLTSLLIVCLWRAGSPMAGGATALAVFALASYPMTLWQFWVLLCCFSTGCGITVKNAGGLRNLTSRSIPIVLAIVISFAGFLNLRRINQQKSSGFRAFYDRGYTLHCLGEWEKSNEELEMGSKMSSDPMFHVIMGKNFEAMGEYVKAEQKYWRARYMVPCRIYPLVRLMRLQIHTGRNKAAIETAETIAAMPVNDRLATMVNLKAECLQTLDSLETVIFR